MSSAPIRTIAELITSDLSVAAQEPVARAVRLFEANPGADGMAVLGDAHVQYLSRSRFFLQLGKRFGFSVFENRPITVLAEEGSTVEAEMEPIEVISLATQREAARIYDDILVLEGGQFVGIVSMRSLLAHHKSLLVTGIAERGLLEEKNHKLRELNQAQARFMATLTGELRAPVSTMLGLARVIQADAGLSPRLGRSLPALVAKALDALGMVDDLQDLTRMELGALQPVMTTVEPRAVLIDVLAGASARLVGGKTQLDVLSEAAPALFITDALMLRRILSNLLLNACARAPEGHVTVRMEELGRDLVVTVADDGPSPAPDVAHSLSGLAEGGVRGPEGGLRLATVRGLAEGLAGSLQATAPAEGGASFVVRLPPGAV